MRKDYEERSKDEAPPTVLGDTHACRAPPRGPRLAREALLEGSRGPTRLNSTKIAESGQNRYNSTEYQVCESNLKCCTYLTSIDRKKCRKQL
jgi:hypothetical protein